MSLDRGMCERCSKSSRECRPSIWVCTGLGMEDYQVDIGGEDIPPVELICDKSVVPSELTCMSHAG